MAVCKWVIDKITTIEFDESGFEPQYNSRESEACMNRTRRVAKSVSYRNYEDFAVVIEHRSGKTLRLNRSGGNLLERVERRETIDDPDELDFLADLSRLGIIEDGRVKPSAHTDRRSPDNEENEPKILRELRDYASQRLIPIQAQIELTYRCPLNCQHCYLKGERRERAEELSTDETKAFLDDFSEMGGLFVVFTGGEPFLRNDLSEIFQHARKRRLAVSILTSGNGIQNGLIEEMAAWGIDSAQVSLHAPDAEDHDRFTGLAGSFDNAWKTLLTFRDNGVPVRAAISVNKLNVARIGELVSQLQDRQIPYNFNLNMLPCRNGDFHPRDLQIEEKELSAIIERFGGRGTPRMKELRADDPPCTAGRGIVSVDPYGNIYPCLMWRQPKGNLKQRSFETIWNDVHVWEEVRSLTLQDVDDCLECERRPFCNRCTGLALMENLSMKSHSALDCRQAGVLESITSKKTER